MLNNEMKSHLFSLSLKNKSKKALYIIFSICMLNACSSNYDEVNNAQLETPTVTLRSTTPAINNDEWAKDWWLPRHESKIIDKNSKSSVDLIFLGDSITHAWENKGKAVWDTYYQPRNALNLGFGGDRTENILWRIQNGEIDNTSPKVVVLLAGTNNAGHFDEASEETALGIKAIISTLNEKLPTTKILLLAIFPRGETKADSKRQLNNKTNSIIKDYADNEKVFFLDINHLFLDENGVIKKSIMGDYLHPNTEQYLKWAQAMEPELNRLMND